MRLANAGEQLIKSFETLELEAYPDPGSALGKACTAAKLKMRDYRKVPGWSSYPGKPWTIGWGHTGPEVEPGDAISESRAQVLFDQDTERFELGVTRLCGAVVNQNQFDACVSFAYNVGFGRPAGNGLPEIAGFETSSLLKYLLVHKFEMASGEFLKWNRSGGVIMLGLVRRRKAERDLFIAPWQGYSAP